jgi:hypothetical protein
MAGTFGPGGNNGIGSSTAPSSPGDGALWRETDAQGVPLYEWPWRWLDSEGEWISDISTPLQTVWFDRTTTTFNQVDLGVFASFEQLWASTFELSYTPEAETISTRIELRRIQLDNNLETFVLRDITNQAANTTERGEYAAGFLFGNSYKYTQLIMRRLSGSGNANARCAIRLHAVRP